MAIGWPGGVTTRGCDTGTVVGRHCVITVSKQGKDPVGLGMNHVFKMNL